MVKFSAISQGEKLQIVCKSDWSEINVSEFLELETIGVDKLGVMKIAKIITGLNLEVVAGIEGEKTFAVLTQICRFVTEKAPDFENIKPPSHLVLGGTAYKCPMDFNKTMYGQKMLLKQLIIDNQKDIIKNLAQIIAIYMQPVIDGGKFDDSRIPEVEKMVLETAAVPAFALARFFFLHSLDLSELGVRGLSLSQRVENQITDLMKPRESVG